MLQMPQYHEHSSAGRPWQAAEVGAHLHALMGFYCAVREQIKKQYLLICEEQKRGQPVGQTQPLYPTH